jgi:RHS repeat-associated protein
MDLVPTVSGRCARLGPCYFNARYYDPTTGRFLTEDPSRKGVNWYAYRENDPINRVDPNGKEPTSTE